jgi:hypothetical protein
MKVLAYDAFSKTPHRRLVLDIRAYPDARGQLSHDFELLCSRSMSDVDGTYVHCN